MLECYGVCNLSNLLQQAKDRNVLLPYGLHYLMQHAYALCEVTPYKQTIPTSCNLQRANNIQIH
jgi:hypothetical protein